MNRSAILRTKQHELATCVSSRKRKLQELYHATVTFASGNLQGDGKRQFGSEKAFLDANDIQEGRFFDPATLRQIVDSDLVTSHGILEPFPSTLPSAVTTVQSTSGFTGELDRLQNHNVVGNGKAWDLQLRSQQATEPAHSIFAEPSGAAASQKAISKAVQADVAPVTQTLTPPADQSLVHSAPQPLRESTPEPCKSPSPHAKEYRNHVLGSSDHTQPPPSGILSSSVGETSSERRKEEQLQAKSVRPMENEDNGYQETHAPGNSNGVQRGASPYSKATKGQIYDQDQQADAYGAIYSTSDVDTGPKARSMDSNGAVSEDLSSAKCKGQPSTVGGSPRNGERQHVPSTASSSKFQVDISQPVLAAPSTPDAQLRLEEAQSLNPPKRHLIKPTDNEDILMEDATAQETNGMNISGDILARPGSSANIDLDQGNRPRDMVDSSPGRRIDSLDTPDHRFSGMTSSNSKDLMLSQRPAMRIDTENLPSSITGQTSVKLPVQAPATTSRSTSTSTPAKTSTTTPAQSSPPERMTTRVSSGALRHKSVSEILGETPKPSIQVCDRTPVDKSSTEGRREEISPLTPGFGQLVTSPDSVQFRSRLNLLREREKERSKLNTVVFARPPPTDSTRGLDTGIGNHMDLQHAPEEPKDYLTPLFKAQASTQSTNSLLGSAHKTLSTSNHYVDFHEQQDCRILRRIYQLQSANRWSLRQVERSTEPTRPTSYWDVLLGHMKWMRTDFREERKWKITAAKNLADWCAEWVATPPDRRSLLQVRIRRRIQKIRSAKNSVVEHLEANDDDSPSEPTPDLIPHGEDDSSDAMDEDIQPMDIVRARAPAAIFSLAPEDVLFSIDKTPISDKLLSELPLYEPSKTLEGAASLASQNFDAIWKSAVVPISKFESLKLMVREQGPPRKKSRYDYADSDDGDHGLSNRAFLALEHTSEPLPPEKDDVALFRPENKHIRDRIHAGHTFRPPSEYNMPSQSFFESRHSSQWTWTEDDELRRLVREYSYNWSLISCCLSSPSLFSSGAERRTPWECFERWVGLDGLPADMSKTQYFRAYHSRLEAAQRTLIAQQQAVQQQQGSNGAQLPLRRRSAQPIRVDRRRNSKHLALVHAMQKLAKKRETAAQKQQHVASMAAMRKANEATKPRQAMQTPQEFSRLKYERECKMQEKADLYRQQVLAQQRAQIQQQKQQQQLAQQQAATNGTQIARSTAPGVMDGTSPRLASSLPHNLLPLGHPNQSRPLPQSHVGLNGVPSTSAQNINSQINTRVGGIPQAQMQPLMQGQQRLPSQMSAENMRLYVEANRVQQQQQSYIAHQRQQQQPHANGQGGSPSSNGNLNIPSQNNNAILAGLHGANGISPSPAINGNSSLSRTSVSPRLGNSMQAQPLSSGMVPAVNHVSAQIKAQNPHASPELVNKLTLDSLNQYRMTQSQNQLAMNSAVGNSVANMMSQQAQQQSVNMMNGVNGSGGSPILNPQMYTQMMRNQQPSQRNRTVAGGQSGMIATATGRPPSRNMQVGSNQSPRPQQAQMAGTQAI